MRRLMSCLVLALCGLCGGSSPATALPLISEPVLTQLPVWGSMAQEPQALAQGLRLLDEALSEQASAAEAALEPEPEPLVEPAWLVPEPAPWPLDEEGYPLVETRRLDVLTWTLTRRFSMRWVRKRFKLSLDRLVALNPARDLEQLDQLEEGSELLVWQREPGLLSRSVGSPNRGRLMDGEPLPPGDKYAILYPHRTFGTYYTISELVRVMDAWAMRFPEVDPVMIGDISMRGGRHLAPHLSHTSGRDVDITYPRLDSPPSLTRFHPIPRRALNLEATVWMLRAFIVSGQVERVFIDRPIQRMLREEAARQGAPEEWLDAVFQYPGRSDRALIVASPGHDDHFHIRFRCQPTDLRCE
jgi:murein endopeptidase